MILRLLRRRPRRLIEALARPLDPLLAALFEDAQTGVLVLGGDRRIVRTNRHLDTMLAVAGLASAAPQAMAEILFAAADRPLVATGLDEALRGEPPPLLQVRLAAADPGAAPSVALSMAPLRETDGAISGLLLRLTDVSAEKRLEADLAHVAKLHEVGQLAGGIAHDFNNLLAAISAAAESVLDRPDGDPATLDDMRQIRDSVGRGAALVRQLLAFGRRQPLQPAVVAVNAAIRNVSDMLSRLLGEHIRLRLELEEPGRSVLVDRSQLDQVLVNLAVNARDAMPAGGTLTLRTGHLTLYQPQQVGQETMPPGRYVAISVEDTGEGIPPEHLPHVFVPFFTTRRDNGGSGLGLSTVHGIVRQSGGFVTVASSVGQGTCVRFWLPRHEASEIVLVPPPAAAPNPLPAAAAMPAVAPHTVLLVEDEQAVRRLTERALQRAGWQVAAVDSAEAALQHLPRPGAPAAPPSVLVSDVLLPGMDGVELVRTMRAVWPSLPAVLVSGYTDSAQLGDLVAQGVTFLAKPYGLKELVACVERAVG